MSETPTTSPAPDDATDAVTEGAGPAAGGSEMAPVGTEADTAPPAAAPPIEVPPTGETLPAAAVSTTAQPVHEPEVPSGAATEADAGGSQSSLAAPAAPVRGLTYAVDIVFCIDVTGSMTPILDAVKANALRFYGDVQNNLVNKGKNVDELRVRVVACRDFVADGEAALEESPFYTLPAERNGFSEFVNGLIPQGGGDAPESGLEAVSLAINSPWTTTGDRRRQVILVWTDQPAQPLNPSVVPADLASRVPADFSALTDAWEDEQGVMGTSSKRLILFAPDGPGWSDISSVWENVVHHPSQAGGGLSEVDYGTIIDSIGNSV